MIKTGITKLDKMLGGGLPESSNILIVGPPGMEKLWFCIKMLLNGVKENQRALLITTDLAPDEIEKKGMEFGMDIFPLSQNNKLKFIDVYSWTLPAKKAGSRHNDIAVPGPSALNELSLAISQALAEISNPGSKLRIIFFSLSSLLLYNNPEIIYRFLQIMGSRLKALNALTLFLMDSGMHDEKIISTIKHLTDGTIELQKDGDKIMLRVPRMSGSKSFSEWKELKLQNGSII
ncbi:MAG: RAD55 family ATPase [Candidatus Aenigmatarchaeota archaeon]